MSTYNELLEYGINLAIEKEKEESAIRILLLHFSKKESYQLVAELDQEADCEKEFKEALNEYIYNNVPAQYLTGFEYFYGHKFIVNEDVLIPRSETEELVSNILIEYDDVFENKKINVVDIGTGSGCLSITLAKEESNMTVMATDISCEALEVAKQNAKNLEVNVEFLQGDMLQPIIDKKFDIIVSNPPYIPAQEYVESLVKDNEPHVALFGGEDGMKFYRIILEEANKILNEEKFIIAFEHAHDKGKEMEELSKKYFPNDEYKLLKDLQNRDRMSFIIRR